MHPEEQTLVKQLVALAKEKGLSYTESDVKNQLARMNLTADGKTCYGDNQFAADAKLQDGTEWNYYGQNVTGQPVWSQNVGLGDPDLQAFIVSNTKGSGMSYQATTAYGGKTGLELGIGAPGPVTYGVVPWGHSTQVTGPSK